MDTTAKLAASILPVLPHLREPCGAGDERLIHQKFVNRFHPWDSCLPEMPEPKVYDFSKHICAFCATRGTDVFKLGAKLGIDPIELLQMINGKVVPTRAVISGLAKELHSDVSLLTKLAADFKRDTGQKLWGVVST
jgi:hypothetical protein